MRKLTIYFLLFSLFACTPKDEKKDYVEYYSISLNKQVENFKENFHSKDIRKLVLQNGIVEQKQITIEQLLNDIKSFKEFDINKPAWKNSYKIVKTEQYTRFETAENKLTLKHIDVYGDEANPSKICIYFQNNNNLYYSSKYIEWDLKKSYSIFSIQDVNGMEADTIFIKSTWN